LVDELLGGFTPPWSIYTPVLRAKASEWKALKDLSPGVRSRIAPLVEFIADWHEPGARQGKRKTRSPQTASDYLQRHLERCLAGTPSDTRSFCDFGHVDSTGQWKGSDVWSEFSNTVPAGAGVVPMAGLRAFGHAPSLVQDVRTRGTLGLRLTVDDLTATLPSRFDAVLRACEVTRESAHVAVDLKDSPRAASHSRIRAALGRVDDLASVVVLAGVFPIDLSDYETGVTVEPRVEWEVWWSEHNNTPRDTRLLSYGDYTTQSARYRTSPSVPGSVSLRYTTDPATLVFRGKQSNSRAGLGYEQMHGHCRLLVRRTDYAGAAFSWGDQRVHCWTDPANGTGNPEQWRRASVVHHITQVAVQLKDVGGSTEAARTWARAQPVGSCA
jgi:hypothetical protein